MVHLKLVKHLAKHWNLSKIRFLIWYYTYDEIVLVLGVSRELAIIEGSHINLEKINYKLVIKSEDAIKIKITKSILCPRYSCRLIKNVKVKESCLLKDRLVMQVKKVLLTSCWYCKLHHVWFRCYSMHLIMINLMVKLLALEMVWKWRNLMSNNENNKLIRRQ